MKNLKLRSIAGLMSLMVAVGSSYAQRVITLPKIVLTEKHAEIVKVPGDAPKIFAARSDNTSVATAVPYRGNSVQIVAVAPGRTTVSFTDSTNNKSYSLPVWVEAASATGGGGSGFDPGGKIQLDQTIMLPKVTQKIAIPNSAGVRVSGIKSSNPSVATARPDPPKGVQIYSRALGDTFIEFVDDTTGKQYQIHVWVTENAFLPGQGGAPSPPAAARSKPTPKPKNPVAAPIGPVRLDPCLVGTWISSPAPNVQGPGFLEPFVYKTGGLKFIVARSGRATFDYSGVPPFVTPPDPEGNATSYKVRGYAVGKIDTLSTDHSINNPSGADEIDISVLVQTRDGSNTGRLNSFFPFGVQGTRYTCTPTSLTLDLGGASLSFTKQ